MIKRFTSVENRSTKTAVAADIQPRRLRLSDRTCLRMLNLYTRRKGYRFTQAKTDQEVEQACQFARTIFDESGFYESEDQPEPPEENGATSIYFLAWQGHELIGTLELVQHPTEFPVELFFHFEFPETLARQTVAELTRFTIAPDHRGRNPVVSVGLLSAALKHSVQHNIHWWIGCTQSLLLASFGSLFRNWQTLPELPLGHRQIRFRKGRDGFFHPGRALRVFLIETNSISFPGAARKLIARRWAARKRR